MAQILFKSDETHVDLNEIPREMGILPLRNMVAFPYMILPLAVAVPASKKLIEDSLKDNHLVGLIASKEPSVTSPCHGRSTRWAP